jgi:(p)ppGpp synthase/HD superfamily hydrolase
MSTLERDVVIAAEAHAGQVDKAGAPYILHPLRLMLQMENTEDRIVAVLHDVVEDTDWTLERLRKEGFPHVIIEAIDSVTWRKNEDYEDFILRAAKNPIGSRVKLADLRDNCDLSRIANPSKTDFKRVDKYRWAIRVIEGYVKRDDFSPE